MEYPVKDAGYVRLKITGVIESSESIKWCTFRCIIDDILKDSLLKTHSSDSWLI